ncbi:MAG: N-(5'-phosphoribosyl)anthranilate isomerase [Alphaproteobacteria bacterium MarineAlpha9_Bin4]|nr:hypothetical protein [Pelagibacterales bacterium]PPR27327.1 MAG: N-(5'-phosphoribosyl)anthranilate isomerase [Alphaproteobacteria bacterium MarineAlpha9_Bin4]|tara:strand:+ start:381 stop:1016 length:636 start_codon:yes stop_codon:yes gene_type:complete
MMPFIKICGIKSLKEVEVAKENHALWYGLVFFKKSPRNISLNAAEMIIKKSPKSIFPVAVTVNPDESFIKKLVDIGIDNIQLHGSETTKYCKFLKEKFKVKIFKGIGLKNKNDINLARKYSNIVDWIIFDKKDNLKYGGTGESFNWNILNKIDINIKYLISGGLTYKNVSEALNITNAKGVDVSSGVEEKHGVKSKELITKFCHSVKLFKR